MDFPEYEASRERAYREGVAAGQAATRPACVGPVAYRDPAAVQADIANLRAALAGVPVADAFMSAASPGVIARFLENQYYPSEETYLFALADAMKTEYDAIHQAGFVLQLDCPDLTDTRFHLGESEAEFQGRVALHLAALDHATRDIPGEAMRLHLCWGNNEGPHTRDVPLADLIGPVGAARPTAISFEAANPRHAHEWVLFEQVTLPDDKVIIPGVLDSTTNYVEHPELVAQRLVQYAKLVGRERVIAGSDCGFATFAANPSVHPTVTWAKLQAMAEGARLATARLWPNDGG